MISTWGTEADFELVVDTLESVSLHPATCLSDAITTNAWRFEEQARPEGDSGAFYRTTTLWQIPLNEQTTRLRPGDRLVDSHHRCGVIVSVEPLQGSTRARCRVVRLSPGLEMPERFDLLRPLSSPAGGDPAPSATTLLRPALEGVWIPNPNSPTTATVYLLEATPAQAGDQVRRGRGGVYEIEEVTRPAEIGSLWEFRVTETTIPA